MYKTIRSAIAFLEKEQQPDGSFLCLVTTEFDNYAKGRGVVVPAIVPTNIVLSSLQQHRDNPVARKIQDKAASFLLGEKGPYWSFNYWFKKSEWFTKEPYPDDTDDTFCALAALYEYDPNIFDGEVMAKIVTMLTSCEVHEGGPYDMWLVPPEGRHIWKDIDLICNANIGYFLHLNDIQLPGLTDFVESSIERKSYEFPYNTPYPGIYFVSRFYRGAKVGQIARFIVSKQEASGAWENPLRTALAVSALMNLKGLRYRKEIEKGIAFLRKTQKANGSWDAYSFYYQMKLPEKTLFAGSAATTTALCVEALQKYTDAIEAIGRKSRNTQTPMAKLSQKEKRMFDAVLKKYAARFSGPAESLLPDATAMARKILAYNPDISLLPYYFRESVRGGDAVSDTDVTTLGLASLCGWVAYTIYDDFLDDEGVPASLSLANLCLRESAELFTHIQTGKGDFAAYAQGLFDTIDAANAWETQHCRDLRALPDFSDLSQLAHKSYGFALGPVAVLFALGYDAASPEVHIFMDFFTHYLIARQLNDDAHDWEDDLTSGQVSAVVARLLKQTKGKSYTPESLRVLFWRTAITSVVKDILKHVAAARKNIARMSYLHNTQMLSRMVDSVENAALEALRERDEAVKFLKTYSLSARKVKVG